MSAAADTHEVPDVPTTRAYDRWFTAFRTPGGIVGLTLMALVAVLAVLAAVGFGPDPAV